MKKYSSVWLTLGTALLLMVIAFYNGFGLVESDTGAYIASGILGLVPRDRTPFYGVFLRITSMWSSLWYTVFAQNLLLAYLLLRYINLLYGERLQPRFALVAVIFIVSFTCVAWVSAYLMPDIFAGILLLAVLLFLADIQAKAGLQFLYCVVIFCSVIIHNSHTPILLGFAILLALWALIKKRFNIVKKAMLLICMSALSWVLICSVNAGGGNGFTYAKGSHVFMITKFAETGILSKYLEDNCPTKHLKLCDYKDDIPDYSWEFLWSDNSPLYKAGGWDSSKQEFDVIIHDVFTTPAYLRMYLQKAASGTLRQLTQVNAPYQASTLGKWSSPWGNIFKYFEDEQKEYDMARHCSQGLFSTRCNYLYLLFFFATSVWIIFHHKLLSREAWLIYGCIALFFVINAFVTSLGSTVIYRFQYRIFWVLPTTNFVLILKYYARQMALLK